MERGPRRGRFGIRSRACAIFLMAFLETLGTAHSAVEEEDLMAAYVYNFSKFVHWPTTAFASTSAPLIICVYGRVAPSEALDALSGKHAQGHPVRVDRRSRGDALSNCHLVYVGLSNSLMSHRCWGRCPGGRC